MMAKTLLHRCVHWLRISAIALAGLLLLWVSTQQVQAQTTGLPLVLQDSTAETDFTTSLAWGDYDNDGDLDLMVGNGMVITDDLEVMLERVNLRVDTLRPEIKAGLRGFMVKNDRRNRLYCNDGGVLTSCWVASENDFTTSVAWGDMDNDGDLDLAVGKAGVGIIVRVGFLTILKSEGRGHNLLYRNDGNGPDGKPRFVRVWTASEPGSTLSVAWGDYDDDGKLDLAVANSNHYLVADITRPGGRPTYENEATPSRIYHNDTDTSVITAQPVFTLDSQFTPAPEVSFNIAWVDADNDHDLDLSVANDGVDQVYCNQRTETGASILQSCWTSNDQDFTVGMSWGDADGNGYPDLAVGNGQVWTGEANYIYFNYGRTPDGRLDLRKAWQSDEADATISVAWGDADSDGDLDLAVGNGNFGANQPSRLYCNDSGTLRTAACWSAPQDDITVSVAWGDVDGDGDLDLATGNISVPVGQQNRLYHNDSVKLTRTFDAWLAPTPDYTRSVAWGDMDGDGDLDLAVGNSGADQIYCNQNGNLVLTAALASSIDETLSVAWGDMDGDSDLDLAVGNERGEPNRLYRNDGLTSDCQPNFVLAYEFTGEDDTRSIAWGDMDGDGDLDLATGNSSYNQLELPIGAHNRIYRNEGMEQAGQPRFNVAWQSAEQDATQSIAWGDVDNDGDLDLAVGNSATPNRLYRNDGMAGSNQAAFTLVWSAEQIDDTHSVAWGDMDGDGDLDLATGNTTQSTRVYCNENGRLMGQDCWRSIEAQRTRSVAWGDMDGDGDLDLATGNQEGPDQIYLNRSGMLSRNAVWTSDDTSITADGSNTSYTLSVAWGDIDGDGDLDLASGNSNNQKSGVYRNRGRAGGAQRDGLPFAAVLRPGETPAAEFFSSAQIIRASAAVSIPFKLFAQDEALSARILPEYSPNGGGRWFPASPGPGGDGLDNLRASAWPTGTSHVFAWNMAADLIKSDNVVFRLRAQTERMYSPILWPALGSQSPPFRVEAPWYVRVVDNRGQPVAGASLYADKQFITMTNQAGLVGPQTLASGADQALVALAPQATMSAPRGGHPDGWVYRIYQTSLAWDENGLGHPLTTTLAGEQRLTTHITTPLVLFNLVVSLEWSADITYTQMIAEAMQQASTYLYDVTDGQMAFGQVTIYDDSQHWTEADIQFAAKNSVHPHTYVGGITSPDPSHVIRLGRAWDGLSGNSGPWNQSDGYRTIAHEFGHYGLSLYDEYFRYAVDADGNLGKRIADLHCISPDNRKPETDATNASIMDWQYTSSELSDRGLTGLWGTDCEFSAHWQLTAQENGHSESPWETLVRHFGDPQSPPRWHFIKPSDRGHILAGPVNLPGGLPDWPTVTISSTGRSGPIRALTVFGPSGPFPNASVTLVKAQRSTIIEQGHTAADGRLQIFGATQGDVVRAISLDGGWVGSTVINANAGLTLTLVPLGNVVATVVAAADDVAQGAAAPYLRIIPEQAQGPQRELRLSFVAQNFDQPLGAQSALTVIVSEPGSESARLTQAGYSPASGDYIGQLSLAVDAVGTNTIQVIGTVAKRVFFLDSTYRLQRIDNQPGQAVYSSDGRLHLELNPQSFTGDEIYFVVTSQNTTPGSIPPDMTAVGDIYEITASGSLATLERPASLTVAYDVALLSEEMMPERLDLYWWDPVNQQWQALNATLDQEHTVLNTSIQALGAYALLAKP